MKQLMKPTKLLLLGVFLISLLLSLIYVHIEIWRRASDEDALFFGVTFGSESANEAKFLIDKVKGYTNLFVVDSWTISINETALNEVCDYAVKANLKFIVFFDYISHVTYSWHLSWLENAKERWGDNFLGVYLYDEPGGRQIDEGQWDRGPQLRGVFSNLSSYSDAASRFITSISMSQSMMDVKNFSISLFTSDYALYWFDYLAGYDTIFTELGWNHSRTQQIALCRGAARTQGKDWGAIITWKYNDPPYLETGPEMLDDMLTAYRAGANYVIIFNYPVVNEYGALRGEHFWALQQFWSRIHAFPRSIFGTIDGEIAYVLPKNYGWGMRWSDDKIWGLWPADTLSLSIWNNATQLTDKYGLKLDIIYDDVDFRLLDKYSKIFFWNATIY
jgi:hypothetical protein